MILVDSAAKQCMGCGGIRLSPCGYTVAGQFPLLYCEDCHMRCLSIEEHPDEDFDDYWDDAAARIYQQEPVVRELQQKYRRYFGRLAELAPNRRFLDVGSGAGISVYTAGEEFGFDAEGIEPSARAVELARTRLGVNVSCGLLGPQSGLPRDFGALTLWDVIEHVEDPAALLTACAHHLAPGGVFLLETPDEGALMRTVIRGVATLTRRRIDPRGSVYYRAHRYYFSRPAMRALLERCGFGQVRFYPEHTMYRKELLYMDFYQTSSTVKRLAIQTTAAITRVIPQLGNKMVVTAIRSRSAGSSAPG